ncbi:MAG TPA: hypothetical protein VN903_24390 [Polyangia bacterium]|nr:hypothetical protein [Polyangia bacterium]
MVRMPTTNKMTVLAFTIATVAFTFTLASTSAAHAQTTPAPAPDPAGLVQAAPAAPAVGATSADPNIDRGFLLPTAMTQPAGSITYNNYELLLHGVTYGITDRVQGSVTVLSPIVRDMPLVGFAAVKGQIVATDRFHLALQGSFGVGHAFNVADGDASVYSVGAGAFASICLRQDCSSLLFVSAIYQLGMFIVGADSAYFVLYSGSIVHRVGRHVKLLGEVASGAGGTGVTGNNENLDGLLVGYGVRFHTDSIAADVGFVKPIATGGGGDDFLVGLPFASVSYRWD